MPRPATIAGRNFHHPHAGTWARPKMTDEATTRIIASTMRFRGESRFTVPPNRWRHAGTRLPGGVVGPKATAQTKRGTPMNIHRVTNSSYTDAFARAKYEYHSGRAAPVGPDTGTPAASRIMA